MKYFLFQRFSIPSSTLNKHTQDNSELSVDDALLLCFLREISRARAVSVEELKSRGRLLRSIFFCCTEISRSDLILFFFSSTVTLLISHFTQQHSNRLSLARFRLPAWIYFFFLLARSVVHCWLESVKNSSFACLLCCWDIWLLHVSFLIFRKSILSLASSIIHNTRKRRRREWNSIFNILLASPRHQMCLSLNHHFSFRRSALLCVRNSSLRFSCSFSQSNGKVSRMEISRRHNVDGLCATLTRAGRKRWRFENGKKKLSNFFPWSFDDDIERPLKSLIICTQSREWAVLSIREANLRCRNRRKEKNVICDRLFLSLYFQKFNFSKCQFSLWAFKETKKLH